MKLRTTFLWIVIVSLSLAALLGIIVILFPDWIGADEEILITALLLGVYSLPSLACSIVLSRRRIHWAMWLGVVCSPVAWMLWQPHIWGNPSRWSSSFEWEVFLWKAPTTLTLLAVWAAHLGMLSLLRLDRLWFRRGRVATLSIAVALGGLSTFLVWAEFDDDWFLRAMAVLAILGGCGTIVTPIFALLDALHRRASRQSIPTDLTVQLVCPRCGENQPFRAGTDRCRTCGLRIDINVEEPRCQCGYLLFHLSGDQCPECGSRVRCACGCLVDDPAGKCPKCGRTITPAINDNDRPAAQPASAGSSTPASAKPAARSRHESQ